MRKLFCLVALVLAGASAHADYSNGSLFIGPSLGILSSSVGFGGMIIAEKQFIKTFSCK